jgi:hypothetical protein
VEIEMKGSKEKEYLQKKKKGEKGRREKSKWQPYWGLLCQRQHRNWDFGKI